MDEFEKMLEAERVSVERFVRFRLNSKADADDVLQEVYLAACQKFHRLKNRESFKAWMISIARNKCNDYFRRKAAQYEIPVDEITERELLDGRHGVSVAAAVRETLSLLGDKDKQILYLYFWKELPQAEIARQLNIPVGTVKSRLHKAKQNFKVKYPHRTEGLKGECTMKKLPELIPEYKIEASAEAPFPVKWEELMGWFLVPKPGEKLSWGMYDIPSRKCSHIYDMQVTGKAKVHGIEGVELTAREASYSDQKDVVNRTFVAQLTDTHCRYLATLRNDGDVRNYITFLDGDEFMLNWGFGEDNCGNETNLTVKGDIRRSGTAVTSADKDFLLDIVGRYTVTIGGKSYDTVCVMDIETYNCGVVSEQFLDREGRTVLWRRYNRDDWAIDSYGKKWSEQLPDNDRLTVNGVTYVHWYDCITDYIL
ncbi:MAG: sigma-70 family RNA polymerase sigma factor [Roseburia sp.]|nr:sigma-70 family RNA polymerase sigma factor [Roseburia sp.]MCM1097552.1 sigma-70 family RNA polymerase sigma factor [Ruminococcus flavefaciens]